MGSLGEATWMTPLHAAIRGNSRPLRTSAKRSGCRMLSTRKLQGGGWEGGQGQAGGRAGGRAAGWRLCLHGWAEASRPPPAMSSLPAFIVLFGLTRQWASLTTGCRRPGGCGWVLRRPSGT